MLEGSNVVVLDLEVLHSPDDCKFCDRAPGEHGGTQAHVYSPIGWENKPALGLSIGCYYDYQCGEVVWFDALSLEATMRVLVTRQPLMVSFNGIGFDFPLMRGILRQAAEDPMSHFAMRGPEFLTWQEEVTRLCDQFKVLAAQSYDILAEIWREDSQSKFVKGLNNLDAIARANGLGGKTGDGAQAPREWAAGKIAQVLNYCQHDVLLTKRLFEQILENDGNIHRADGLMTIRLPHMESSAV